MAAAVPGRSRLARAAGALVALSTALGALPAAAAETIAFVGALSGPQAAAGRDQRDGFLLAVAEQRGRLGGVAVDVVPFDDAGDAARVPAIARRLVARRVRYVTGMTSADATVALQSALARERVLLVSSGSAPVALAGVGCSPRFASTASADDTVHENAGAIAQARGYASVRIVAPGADRAAVAAAFAHRFTGTVIGGGDDAGAAARSPAEVVAGLRKERPEAVYVALPLAEAAAFLDAYEAAGFYNRVPVIVADAPGLVDALGRKFQGLTVSAPWSPHLESDAARDFAERYRKRYGRLPSTQALQGYDAALLLGAAFRAAQGRAAAVEAVARALPAQRVDGPAGTLRLAQNGYAVRDWRAWEIYSDAADSPYLVARERTLRDHVDAHAARCRAG